MALFAFEHVTKRVTDGRHELTVLEDVCFEVDAGDFVGLWGSRRSGKSTLLRLAAGLESPDAGRILFDGHDLTALSGNQRAELMRSGGIAHVCSAWRPSFSQEVIEYVGLPLLADSMSLRQARRVAREQLERMGVLNCAHLPTERLSVGELVRVGLAQALAREPRLLLVDEPAVLPSPSERQELYNLLASLGRIPTLAVLVASEDIAIIRRAPRRMTVGAGSVHSMDKDGQVVSFPLDRVADRRSTGG
jgi:predicted ABC-type transport system involved in lysophospholipase L1 biosynthesis ATPase subunit